MKRVPLTVIIPTYNRENILKECLNALFRQTYQLSDFEIVVIDDGSTDGTERVVKKIIPDSPVVLRYFKQENKGPAAARNVGIKNAQGNIVLFIGDDIIVIPELLKEHMKWHKSNSENNVAILGFVTWSPETKVTPFMEYIGEEGIQFGFKLINNKENVPYNFFYTSNISLKRNYLLKNGFFDEDFSYAALEDIELAYRLKKKGLKIVYNKKAIAYHNHVVTQKDYCKRMEISGRASKKFHEKHPELKSPKVQYHPPLYKSVVKSLLWYISIPFGRVIPKKFLNIVYWHMLKLFFQKGYEE